MALSILRFRSLSMREDADKFRRGHFRHFIADTGLAEFYGDDDGRFTFSERRGA